MKTKTLISFVVTALFLYMQKSGFLTTRLTWLFGMVLLMVTLYWTHSGLRMDPFEKMFMSFDFIVPHEAHDQFVLGLTLF